MLFRLQLVFKIIIITIIVIFQAVFKVNLDFDPTGKKFLSLNKRKNIKILHINEACEFSCEVIFTDIILRIKFSQKLISGIRLMKNVIIKVVTKI